MRPLPPAAPTGRVHHEVRLPRDYYLRVLGNDYSVDPSAIGRMIDVHADLDTGHRPLRRRRHRVPPAQLGPAPDHHRPGPRRRRRPAARPATSTPAPPAAGRAATRTRWCVTWPTTTPGSASTSMRTGRGDGLMAAVPAGHDQGRSSTTPPRSKHRGSVTAPPGWPTRPATPAGPTRNTWPRCCHAKSSSRESSGSELRIRAAGFPSRKAIEEFNFDHQPGLSRDIIAHLAHRPVPRQSPQRRAPRTARNRQNPPVDRAGDRRRPARAPGRCSPPPSTGSPACKPPTSTDGCPPNSPGCAATACSSSTKSATSRSSKTPRTCSSSWSPPATNTPR